MAIIHEASRVRRARDPLPTEAAMLGLERLTGAPVEACSGLAVPIVPCEYHPFVQALHVAFATHRPVVLSPDMFWLLIAQGMARIVNENAEEMRHLFVREKTRETIVVRRDEFIKGSPENDWPGAFDEFSARIRDHIGEANQDSLVTRFSTTGPVEKAAFEVVLMDAMQSYFDYRMMTICGIPLIHLEGTADDWRLLLERAESLGARFECAWWIDRVRPWLARIAACARGADDRELWCRIYKMDDSSGGPYAGGWITRFFPYLQSPSWDDDDDDTGLYPNPLLDSDDLEPAEFEGVTSDRWPGALSLVPFTWEYRNERFPMEFLAGFTGFTQDEESLAVRPEIGWAVREATA